MTISNSCRFITKCLYNVNDPITGEKTISLQHAINTVHSNAQQWLCQITSFRDTGMHCDILRNRRHWAGLYLWYLRPCVLWQHSLHIHMFCVSLHLMHSHIISACDRVSDAQREGPLLQNKHTQANSWEHEAGSESLSSPSELEALLCRQFSLIRNNCTGPKSNKERSRARLSLCVTQRVGCHYEWGGFIYRLTLAEHQVTSETIFLLFHPSKDGNLLWILTDK